MPKLDDVQQTSARRGGRRGRAMRVSSSLAEINVVPLVDVMLVLLIIFMVTAPMMQQGFSVRLPSSRRSTPVVAEPVYITIPLSFRQDGKVKIGEVGIPLGVLASRVKQELNGRATQDIYLGGDGGVTMDELVRVLDVLKDGGVDRVQIATQPGTGKRAS